MPVASVTDTEHRRRDELTRLGRGRRRRLGRRAIGRWRPADDRPDPVAVLAAQDDGRVRELVPIRYGRMLRSPFAFFRGSAAIMAADLGAVASTGLRVQACGDAHIDNFGVYAGADRMLVYDVNDFDETLPAPFELDVRRLSASIVLAARAAGWSDDLGRSLVRSAVARYRDVLRQSCALTTLEVQYQRLDERRFFDEFRDPAVRRYSERVLAKARTRTNRSAFDKWVEAGAGSPRFVDDPPLLTRLPAAAEERFHELFNGYRESLPADRRHVVDQFRFCDVAQKVVGVGSVGLRAYVILLEGHGRPDPLILQVKEAVESVLSRHWGTSGYATEGRRVVIGQRLMQATSDPFLGWSPFIGRDFYVRQLRDNKGPSGGTPTKKRPFEVEVTVAGGTLARAHARSVDPALLAGYLGRNDRVPDAMARFATRYADQAEADFCLLERAARQGRVPAERGI